jgi:MFS family permease
MINASFLLMAGLLSIPLGNLSDRLGRRSLIVAGLAILSGSSFLLRLSIIPLQMMGIYLLFGVGLAAFAQTMMASSAIMGGVIKGVGFAGRFLVSAMFSALMTGGYFLMTRRGNHENLD